MSGFELVATLCLAGLCAARVIPAPVPQSEDACTASAKTILENRRETRPGSTIDAMDCVPLEDLAGKAAAVIKLRRAILCISDRSKRLGQARSEILPTRVSSSGQRLSR